MAWSSLEELATCTAVDSQAVAPGSEGSAPVAAIILAMMAPAAVEEAVARTAVAAQSAIDATVAPDADAAADAEGSASGESPGAAADHMAEVAADSGEVRDVDTCAPVGTRRSGLDPHCRQSVLVVPVHNPT